ncbi:MAG: hypothetical protein L0Y71_11280 [Gemmataceae bacterium]|nr:hypothetical protein [Gemmataceae bacterium]
MVLAYHVIFGTYGFWLPNDPRSSWSDFVHAWELFRFGGPATRTDTRRSLAGRKHDAAFRHEAKQHLKYPPVVLTDDQIASAAKGFQAMVNKSRYRMFACAILPEHVHMVIGRYTYKVESMVRLLKAQASTQLQSDQLHPMQAWPLADSSLHSPWAEKCWKVFLDTADGIVRAIRYVEQNPIKEGRLAQLWPFVIPFGPDDV